MKFTSELMREVHRIAATMEGDYVARLSLAFREVLKNEELEGSEKQVAWAKDIKAEMLAKVTFHVEKNFNNKKVLLVLIEELVNEKSAKFFIENREALELNHEIVTYMIEKFDFNNRKAEIVEREKAL